MQNRSALTVEQITEIAVQAAMAAVQAALTTDQPKAEPTRTAKAPAKPAPAKPLAKAPKCLVRKNRAEFVKANPWAAGLSVWDISIAVMHLGQTVKGAWQLGEAREGLALGATDCAIDEVRAHLGL
jgi:hypothetical protein